MKQLQAEMVLEHVAALGEGALWDDRAGRLLWVDIPMGEIHAFDPATGQDRLLYQSGSQIGTVVQREKGGLLAATDKGLVFIDEQTGTVQSICNPEQDKQQNRFNDGKCGPDGRFWAGTMAGGPGSEGQGSLYRLDADLSCHRVLEGVTISNGIAWNPDGNTMYYTDTPTRQIWAFDYDQKTGCITNRRTVVEIAPGEGGPDGFTVDAEGMLWVAQWGGWQVARYDPATGNKITKVNVPAGQVTSCAFGGKQLDTLFITTASVGLSKADQENQPLAGCLFKADAGVVGMRACRFFG